MEPELLEKVKRYDLLNQSIGANKIGMLFISIEPKAPPHVPYHFHKKKESAFFILEGKAQFIAEGKKYVLTPYMAVYIPPNEKHQVINIGETELKMIEVYSPPPLAEDNYQVKE